MPGSLLGPSSLLLLLMMMMMTSVLFSVLSLDGLLANDCVDAVDCVSTVPTFTFSVNL